MKNNPLKSDDYIQQLYVLKLMHIKKTEIKSVISNES